MRNGYEPDHGRGLGPDDETLGALHPYFVSVQREVALAPNDEAGRLALKEWAIRFRPPIKAGELTWRDAFDGLLQVAAANALYSIGERGDIECLISKALGSRSLGGPSDSLRSPSVNLDRFDNETLDRFAEKQATVIQVPTLEVLCLADVTPRSIEWLWKNWIAIGKVSVLAGDGGIGKSTILCDLAARQTTGNRWPDGAEGSSCGGVLILAAEDDVEDTLAPRLLAAGADMQRVFTIRSVITGTARRTFSLQGDLERLEHEIKNRSNIRLVIIDPISSYLGKVDSHKNAEVRSVLEPLGEMAARMRVAVICNNHFSKGGGNANSRIIGSVAFVNQARAAFIVTPDAEDESRMLLMPSKMNLAPIKHGLAYRIEGCLVSGENGEEILTSRIWWESSPVTISADEALAAHDRDGESKTAKEEALEFLTDALRDGPQAVKDVAAKARAAGHSSKSLRSAREALGIKPEKAGFDGGWQWALPKMPSAPEDAHVRERAPSAPGGHLRVLGDGLDDLK